MKHQDRSQTSIEEFEIIKKIGPVMGCKFIDFDKTEENKYR